MRWYCVTGEYLLCRPERGSWPVGFAAEYGEDGVSRARKKRERKSLDMIVYNDISRADIGFDSDYNEVILITAVDEVKIERAPKETVAETILDHIARAMWSRMVSATVSCGARSILTSSTAVMSMTSL